VPYISQIDTVPPRRAAAFAATDRWLSIGQFEEPSQDLLPPLPRKENRQPRIVAIAVLQLHRPLAEDPVRNDAADQAFLRGSGPAGLSRARSSILARNRSSSLARTRSPGRAMVDIEPRGLALVQLLQPGSIPVIRVARRAVP
jgi:hypothetical protein